MPRRLSLAVTTLEISDYDDSGRIQLLPYGEFRALDGRPDDVPQWIVNEENGDDLCSLANSYHNRLVLDYEHQTLNSLTNGQPAPAAGWLTYLYFTTKGIFADVEFTEKAAKMIRDGEYRYISPVFSYDSDGFVRKIHHAALTNNPALDGMDEVIAASTQLFQVSPILNTEKPMLALLRKLFGLPDDADEKTIEAAITALSNTMPNGAVPLSQVYEKLAAATAKTVDLSQYVPVSVVEDLKGQLASLSAQINTDKATGLIETALKDGRLLPAQKDWAEKLAQTDLVALTEYLDATQPIAALVGNQGDHATKDAGESATALSADQKEILKQFGLNADKSAGDK